MAKGINFEATTFTAGEAGEISGLNPMRQQNLRRHKYLPPTPQGTWTRYDLKMMGVLLIHGRCSDLAIPPKTAKAIIASATTAAVFILGFAQKCTGVIDNPLGLATGKPITFGPTQQLRRFLISYGTEVTFQNDIGEFYAKKWDADLSAAIVFDLKRMADHLCERAGRPLWKVVEAD
jgi:hypothetical protein